jgi:integrase
LTEGSKNLAIVDTTQKQQQQTGAITRLDEATIKGKLVEFALWLIKQGYGEEVARNRVFVVRRLANLGANLLDPETVKEVLAKQKAWNGGYKVLIVYAYESFLKMEGLSWKRPHYTQPETFPFIPTEVELDQLISACSRRVGTFLQGLKDTGADPGELAALQWTNINKESRQIQIRPVKNHYPRVLTVSQQFLDRLERLPKKSERIFNLRSLGVLFTKQRKRIANKLANPRLLQICFTTFRHWKGTIEYHRTRDILYVKKILGHKNIQNTLKYIDLEAYIFKTTDDQFIVKVADNIEEACRLMEVGFEKHDEYDGIHIYRKRR